ncbi:MAG: cytochrome c biogenesis protein CcdA, partial [Chloroflexota bacterium]
LVYGIGGFCSGPLLGGVLTIAGASGGAVQGAVLLAVFAAGMAAPLLVLALAWERIGVGGRARLRGREVRIGRWTRHSSIVASSVLFMVLGLAFIAFQGGNALGGLYAAVGASEVSLRIEVAVRNLASQSPWLLAAMVVVPGAGLVLAVVRRDRSDPPVDTGRDGSQG